MSIVKSHDIIQSSANIRGLKKQLNELQDGKVSAIDFSGQDCERVIKDLNALERLTIRQKASLAISHQKILKAQYTETWNGDLGNGKQTFTDKLGRKLNFSYQPQRKSIPSEWIFFPIYPQMLSGYQALKKKYQYFKINKVDIKFVANTANNLSPIICRYMPPIPIVEDLNDIDTRYITKYAESIGSTYGNISIHVPPCLIKKGEYDKVGNFTMGTNGFCMPQLCKDRMITLFEKQQMYLDYGYFIFETRNVSEHQSIIVQLNYQLDFYSGYDYEAAEALYIPMDGQETPEQISDDDTLQDSKVQETKKKGSGYYSIKKKEGK